MAAFGEYARRRPFCHETGEGNTQKENHRDLEQAPKQITKSPWPLKECAIALSLANLCFYPVWSQLLPGSYGHFYLKNPPALFVNTGAMLAMLLLATLFWILFRFAKRSGSSFVLLLAQFGFLAVFLLALNGIRFHHLRFSSMAPSETLGSTDAFWKLTLALFALAACSPWRRRVIHTAVMAVLVLSPFAAVTLSQAAWAGFKSKIGIPFAEFADQPAASLLPSKPGARRVVWFLFDGTDQSIAFANRPSGVELPNLDRFRSEAVYAPHAYSPAGSTLLSLPALLMGKPIDEARPLRPDELMVRFYDTQQRVSWGAQPNVFSRVRDLGLNSALVGYHLPYGRILGKDLASCVWAADRWDSVGMDDPKVSIPDAASGFLALSAERILASLPLVWRVPQISKLETLLQRRRPLRVRLAEHIQTYRIILEAARKDSANPSFQLVFVHWPVPHHPYIYDGARGDFSLEKETSYVDNLVLADRTLGEVRKEMERAGVWDDSIILITADHGLKTSRQGHSLGRADVVFLLKLPHQRQEVVCPTPFCTVLIPDLILKLLQEERIDPDSVMAWIRQSPWVRPRIGH